MREILTKDKKHLTLFEDNIVIDKRLPKWRNAEENISKPNVSTVSLYNIGVNETLSNVHPTPINNSLPYEDEFDPDAHINSSPSNIPLYKTPEGLDFNELATLGIKDLTKLIAEKKLKYIVGGYGAFGSTGINSLYGSSDTELSFYNNSDKMLESINEKLTPWYEKLFKFLKNKKKTNHIDNKTDANTIDALKFFTLVKSTSKESAMTYKNRVEKYLMALHNATKIGQTALQEELIKGLITNRYESVLYSEGYYYAIDEEKIVEFINKCEKGIKLNYIKNFNRPLPQDVVEKIQTLNDLEIFDNYVVLYYDPDGKTYKETAEEVAKRRDPIIFGLIAGSKKLYYVGDWIDEYCDLTLEKFVETLGVDKDVFLIDEKPSEKTKTEKPKSKKKNYHKNKQNYKKTTKN